MIRALYGLTLLLAAVLVVGALAVRPAAIGIALLATAAWTLAERRLTALQYAPSSWLAALVLVVVVAGVCLPTLRGDFVGDDFGYVQLFHDKSLTSFTQLGDISQGIWQQPLDELRPLFALSYRLDAMLHGLNAGGFHADNIVLHVLVCLLVYALVRTLQPGNVWPALAASLLFGLMPVHVEPVAWITGKVDSLPTLFYLLVLLLFVRFRVRRSRAAYAAAVVLFALGLFSKEILITLPAVLVAFDLLLARHVAPADARPLLRRALHHLPFVALTGGFLILRHAVFGVSAREGHGLSLNRLKAFLLAQPEKVRWMLTPFAHWNWSEVLFAGLILGALAGAALWLWQRRAEHERCVAQIVFFGLAFYGITLLPLAVTYRSTRHLYLPSAGVAIALGLLLVPVAQDGRARLSSVRLGSLLLLLVVCALELHRADERWIAAGEVSRLVRMQLDEALRQIPAGRTVLIGGVPGTEGSVLVWKFALPFALQPPFATRDAYGPYQILERPELYCCPLERWWSAKRPLVAALLHGNPDETVAVTLLQWNARRQKIVVREGRPLRQLLRTQLTRAMGLPLESMDSIDGTQAPRLMATLEAVVRLSAAQVPENSAE